MSRDNELYEKHETTDADVFEQLIAEQQQQLASSNEKLQIFTKTPEQTEQTEQEQIEKQAIFERTLHELNDKTSSNFKKLFDIFKKLETPYEGFLINKNLENIFNACLNKLSNIFLLHFSSNSSKDLHFNNNEANDYDTLCNLLASIQGEYTACNINPVDVEKLLYIILSNKDYSTTFSEKYKISMLDDFILFFNTLGSEQENESKKLNLYFNLQNNINNVFSYRNHPSPDKIIQNISYIIDKEDKDSLDTFLNSRFKKALAWLDEESRISFNEIYETFTKRPDHYATLLTQCANLQEKVGIDIGFIIEQLKEDDQNISKEMIFEHIMRNLINDEVATKKLEKYIREYKEAMNGEEASLYGIIHKLKFILNAKCEKEKNEKSGIFVEISHMPFIFEIISNNQKSVYFEIYNTLYNTVEMLKENIDDNINQLNISSNSIALSSLLDIHSKIVQSCTELDKLSAFLEKHNYIIENNLRIKAIEKFIYEKINKNPSKYHLCLQNLSLPFIGEQHDFKEKLTSGLYHLKQFMNTLSHDKKISGTHFTKIINIAFAKNYEQKKFYSDKIDFIKQFDKLFTLLDDENISSYAINAAYLNIKSELERMIMDADQPHAEETMHYAFDKLCKLVGQDWTLEKLEQHVTNRLMTDEITSALQDFINAIKKISREPTAIFFAANNLLSAIGNLANNNDNITVMNDILDHETSREIIFTLLRNNNLPKLSNNDIKNLMQIKEGIAHFHGLCQENKKDNKLYETYDTILCEKEVNNEKNEALKKQFNSVNLALIWIETIFLSPTQKDKLHSQKVKIRPDFDTPKNFFNIHLGLTKYQYEDTLIAWGTSVIDNLSHYFVRFGLREIEGHNQHHNVILLLQKIEKILKENRETPVIDRYHEIIDALKKAQPKKGHLRKIINKCLNEVADFQQIAEDPKSATYQAMKDRETRSLREDQDIEKGINRTLYPIIKQKRIEYEMSLLDSKRVKKYQQREASNQNIDPDKLITYAIEKESKFILLFRWIDYLLSATNAIIRELERQPNIRRAGTFNVPSNGLFSRSIFSRPTPPTALPVVEGEAFRSEGEENTQVACS